MKFIDLVEGYEEMTHTSSRKELTQILVKILKRASVSEIGKVAYLTQGKLYPDFEGIEIGMAEKTASKAIEKAYGAEQSTIQQLMQKRGDLGDVAGELSKNKAQQSFFTEELTLENVFGTLDEIARMSGQGSAETKMKKLTMLLNSASSLEAKFLIRFVTGKLRLGVADFTVLDALAIAFTEDKENRVKLEYAYNLTSDLGFVATTLAKDGIRAIENVHPQAGRPIRPMLAERMESADAIIEKMRANATAEYKLDGERIQAHKMRNGEILLFSRRLELITSQYMDVIQSLKSIPAKEFIVEGEVVAIDPDGRYLPFQELMHRRRKYDLEEAMKNYPVKLNLFDILLIDGKEMINEPYGTRRKTLERIFKTKSLDRVSIRLVPAKRVAKSAQIDELMEESLSAGCEGLVVKDQESTYKAGARGFAWVKFKPEYRPDVRDTLDLVIVGADHGKGRRAGVFGTFLLAAYDDEADVFRSTTKVGTGFSDESLDNLTTVLNEQRIADRSPRVDSRASAEVWFQPKVVIEIIASEITLSPIYSAGLNLVREESGLALRFPKFTGKVREDKSPEDSTTVKELLEMYQRQTRQFKPG